MDTSIPFSTSVREFQDACYARGIECARNDQELYDEQAKDTVHVAARLIMEEAYELVEALQYKSKAEVLREAADVLYVVYGALARFGLDGALIPAFNRIHAANMTKIEKGGVKDGKLIKPADFTPAKLGDLVEAGCSF